MFSDDEPSAVVTMGFYPGWVAGIGGTIAMQAQGSDLHIYGLLTGLEPSVTGGWHIHAGFTCDDSDSVGDHYCEDGTCAVDPWTPITYTSDASGVAEISLTIPGFSLNGEMPVLGRALVVHASAAAGKGRRGCGLIVPALGKMAMMSSYPGATNSVKGLLSVATSDAGVMITGTLAGLEANVEAGWHVHTGYSCDKPLKEAVDGDGPAHYGDTQSSGGSDPWANVKYMSDSMGVAQVDMDISGFSLMTVDTWPMFGHTVVVHASDSSRAGCGVIGGMFGVSAASVKATTYPGFDGTQQVTAMGWVSEYAGMLKLQVLITGLEPSATGGWHVHSGFTCDNADGAGPAHYGDTSSTGGSDPWAETTYTSDANGVAMVEFPTTQFSLEGVMPIAGHTLVVHLSGGARAACGVIVPSAAAVTMLGKYPEYAGALAVQGMVTTEKMSIGIRQAGLVAGLEPSVTGGWHIHTGFTCDVSDDVDGGGPAHYGDMRSTGGTDPWATVTYTSDAMGVAEISLTIPRFSLEGEMPVLGRALVVHQSGGPRAGCGVIESFTGQIAQIAEIGRAHV